MYQELTRLPLRGARRTAKRPWGLYGVALACTTGFAANAFQLQTWLLLAALYVAALAQPQRVSPGFSQPRFLTLVAFSILYWLASPGLQVSIFPMAAYPIAYLVGLLIVSGPLGEHRRLTTVITACVFGATLHGVLNAAANFQRYGWSLPSRVLPDYWTNELLTATLQGTLFIPLVGYSYYSLMTRSGRRALRVALTLVGMGVAIGYSLATASRTIFVIVALTFGACFSAGARRRPREAWGLALCALLAMLIYAGDVFFVRSLVGDSALSRRMAETDSAIMGGDPRVSRWANIVENFWDHTTGGLKFRATNGYAHNLWLDAYDVAGLLPLILLLAFSLAALAQLLKVIRSPLFSADLKFLVGGLWVAMLAQFMTEPILDGAPYLFALFCLLVGCVDGATRGIPVSGTRLRPSRSST